MNSGQKTDPIPLLWSAPESLLECLFTDKSMVYLAGRTSIEILSHGVHPFQEIDGPIQDRVMLVLIDTHNITKASYLI